MPRRIDLGRAVLLAGSVLLFISLFLRWYDTDVTGWQVFESLDLVLAGLAVAGVVVALAPTAPALATAVGVPGAAVVIVLVQLVNSPPAAGGGHPAVGAWLALAGAVAMGAGVAQSLSSVSVTVTVGERRLRRRVAAVDLRGDELAAEAEAPADGTEPDAVDPTSARRTGRFRPRPGVPAGGLQRTESLPALADTGDESTDRS